LRRAARDVRLVNLPEASGVIGFDELLVAGD
jgi:hypothetical protein